MEPGSYYRSDIGFIDVRREGEAHNPDAWWTGVIVEETIGPEDSWRNIIFTTIAWSALSLLVFKAIGVFVGWLS